MPDLVSVVLMALLSQQPVTGDKLAAITVHCTTLSDEGVSFEMQDDGDGRMWVQFLRRGHHTRVTLHSSMEVDDGYGSLSYRARGESTWRHLGRLRDGQELTL